MSHFFTRPRKQTVSAGTDSPSLNSVPYDLLPARSEGSRSSKSSNERRTPTASRSSNVSSDSSRSTSRTSSLNGHAGASEHVSRSSRGDARQMERRRLDTGPDSLSAHSVRGVEDPTATPRGGGYADFEGRRQLERGPSISTVSSRASSTISSAPSSASLQSHANTLATQSSRYSGISYHSTSTMPADPDFYYPRPTDDAEVHRLFAKFISKRGLDRAPSGASSTNSPSKQQRNVVEDMLAWPVEKKWQLVYTQALNEYQAQKKKPSKSSRAISAMVQMPPPDLPLSKTFSRTDEPRPAPVEAKVQSELKRDRPEDYLQMFMDGTITAKHVASLNVGLRTYEVAWLSAFIRLQGQSVLATTLGKLAREGATMPPREADLVLEYEISKCLKTLLNSKAGANDAVAHPASITHITHAIITPHLPTRKTVADVLIFLTHWEKGIGHRLVLQGFDALQKFRHAHGRFDAWLEAFEYSIDGRGRMGSMVGASDEIRSLRGRQALSMIQASGTGQLDNALNEYALSNLLLMTSILTVPEEYEVRIHLRSQLEGAGLLRIFKKLRFFGHPLLDRQMQIYDKDAEDDRAALKEAMESNLLTSLTEPDAIVHAILESTAQQPRARDFFVSTLQHLLLIREEGEDRVRHFGLIDQLVTSIVMDRQGVDSDFSSLTGASVASVISRMADSDRLQQALQETTELKRTIVKMRRDKERIDEEIEQTNDGLVLQLKNKLSRAEEDLRIARQNVNVLTQRVDDMDRSHQSALADQDVQTRELFNMLKEARTLELIEDKDGILDRKALMEQMEKKLQRTKTIFTLEGRNSRSKPRPSAPAALPSLLPAASIERTPTVKEPKERTSQFADATDGAVRKHIEDALTYDLANMSPFGSSSRAASPAQSTRKGSRPPTPSPVLSRRAPASPGDVDATPLAGRTKPLPDVGLSTRMPKAAFPMGLMDQIRSRGSSKDVEDVDSPDLTQGERDSITTAATDETAATSISSPPRPVKSDKRTHSRNVTAESTSVLVPPPPPPAPPPPPFTRSTPQPTKSALSSSVSSTPAAPLPPVPPPLPGLKASVSPVGKQTMSLMDQLKQRASPDGRSTLVEVPEGSQVARPGSIIVPPAPPGLLSSRGPSFGRTPRKEVAAMAQQQLKQLQWDNLPQLQADKTVWAKATAIDETEVASMLKKEGILAEMEEDFRAQQAKLNVAKKQQAKKQLKSVLNSATRQRIEIVLKKASSTETDVASRITDLSSRILQFDETLCTEAFLQEMKSILPSAEDIGKLNVYRNAPDDQLAELHHADRFLVELIKVPRLNQRVDGMYYYVRFDEQYEQLTDLAARVTEACEALQNAKHFRDLLNLILLFGNYMNANGLKGGAFGFRVSSINKLVDTKASNGATLLQFLEKTIRGKFADTA